MSKVIVSVERTLCKSITLEVLDGLTADERIEWAEDKVRKMMRNEQLVLT